MAREIRRRTCRHDSTEGKIRIVLASLCPSEGTAPSVGMAAALLECDQPGISHRLDTAEWAEGETSALVEPEVGIPGLRKRPRRRA